MFKERIIENITLYHFYTASRPVYFKSNTMSNISVSKFEVDGKVLYGKVIWNQNKHNLFHIKIYEGETTWSGNFSKETANKYRDRLDLTEAEYDEDVKLGLTGQCTSFNYDFKPVQGDDSFTFRWSKKIQDGLITYGCVPLKYDASVGSKDSLIDLLLLENKNLRNTVSNMTIHNEQIGKNLEKCKFELENFSNIKSTLETSLYGKFVQLLNSKKRRIELLEENILNYGEPAKKAG